MSKKSKKIAVPVKRRRRRKNPAALVTASASPTSNPPLFTDLAEFVVPGFGGYAATRLFSRITYNQLVKKWPNASRHAAVGSSLAAFLAAWYLLHRWERVKKYHTPATVGAAIAALQTIVQTYLPKFGWIVSDFQPTTGSATNPLSSRPLPKPTAAQIQAAEEELMAQDDEDDAVVDPLTPTGPVLGTLGGGSTLGSFPEDDTDLDEYIKNLTN